MIVDDYPKFMALDDEKRERILNAAMGEFLNGYKNASTDNIVREAGISKGLLFHYFGTKEKLYDFLVDYAIDIVQREYVDLINLHQQDILDSIWQLSLLKQDLSYRYPTIFDFLTRVYVDDKDCPAKEHLLKFQAMQAQAMAEILRNCDKSLFKDDIPHDKAIEIIWWAQVGYAAKKLKDIEKDSIGKTARENYEKYLEEFKEYLDILRKCFYK